MRRLEVRAERWLLAAPFVIARGAKTEAAVVVCELTQADARGRGECVPYARYGESLDSVVADIESVRAALEADADRAALQRRLPPGAARNALDCALWDLEAKTTGEPAWRRAEVERPTWIETAFTLSLAPAPELARAARAAAGRPVLKLKLGGGVEDLDLVRTVREAAPDARLIVDANEAFDFDTLRRVAPEFARLGVALVEQPLAAGADAELEGWPSPVALCADESLHTRAELAACAGRYRCVNIKLDKAGGLTEALALRTAARAAGLSVMVGCMVSTSLSMAPAMLLSAGAAFVDLDGPLLLAQDRPEGLTVEGSRLGPAPPALWG